MCVLWLFFFFFKQKTAYEMRISDWSSDVCSSDLGAGLLRQHWQSGPARLHGHRPGGQRVQPDHGALQFGAAPAAAVRALRSEEHTSELQSLMRISYAVFCFKKNNTGNPHAEFSSNKAFNIVRHQLYTHKTKKHI